ncbi:hypothetical protein MKY59_21310 [Paenibacillus sp. FSL W8-0426]|uniref:hypothetical protein n=1 Tax=Paenibacillus sp. FSL W8-0426 TaxID=2921714 RepID=UPI0030D94518
MLHIVYQRHHIPPDEVYGKTGSQRAMMYASDLIVLEDEERERRKAALKQQQGRSR